MDLCRCPLGGRRPTDLLTGTSPGRIVKVLGFTGMPGSGKSEAMSVVRRRGIPVVRMGDLVWEEVDRQGLPRDAANVGRVAHETRAEEGEDVWAMRSVQRVRKEHGDAPLVVIDGVRSNHEVQVFRRELGEDFMLVAIHTDRGERFRRMTARARDDDPTEEGQHEARDQREMGWGIARTIALADEMVVNDATLPVFQAKVAALLDSLA